MEGILAELWRYEHDGGTTIWVRGERKSVKACQAWQSEGRGGIRRSAGGRYACRSSGGFLGRRKDQVASSYCEWGRSDPALLQFAEECRRESCRPCGAENCAGRRL